MSSHLTKQPPSWRNWVLSKLGLTDLPTPVNCWYCNQTMYLLPGSKQTEQHWYCNLCENTNVIDECGDIMDAPPLPDTAKSSYVLSLEQRKKNQQTLSTFSRSASRRTLCDDCQHNQTLIYQFMSDYILDESDPDYEDHERNVDSYQQSLHEKHPLCKDCQAKIQNIVAEQLATVSRRKINEQRQRSLQSITPTRLTSNQHICYGLVWLFLHCSFMIICAFAIFHPFQSSGHETVVASLQKWLWYASDYIMSLFAKNSERHTTILSASSPPSLLGGPYCFTHLTGPILSETCNAFWFLVNAPVATAKILLDLDADQETPQHIKNVNDIGLNFYVVFYASSFYFMDWHFRASRTFLNTAKPRYWKVYKVVQRFLYCSRLVFLFLLKFMTLSVTFLKIFSCIYILLLLWSVLLVKLKKTVKQNDVPRKATGESDINQRRQSLIQNHQLLQSPSVPNLSVSSSSSTTPTNPYHHIPTDLYDDQKSAWYATPLKLLSWQHYDEDEVDGLASDLGKISV